MEGGALHSALGDPEETMLVWHPQMTPQHNSAMGMANYYRKWERVKGFTITF